MQQVHYLFNDHRRKRKLEVLFFCLFLISSFLPAPNPLCVRTPLQATHKQSIRKEMLIFGLKVHLPGQPHIALSCFLHLIFQNCLCKAQNWEGRTKVSLVITTKRREHSPIRITFKCTIKPQSKTQGSDHNREGEGVGKAKLTKQKVKERVAWLEGKLIQGTFWPRTGLKPPPPPPPPPPAPPRLPEWLHLPPASSTAGEESPI